MNRVEPSVVRIVWIEGQGDDTSGVHRIRREFRKNLGKMQVWSERLASLVQNVEGSALIVNEQSRGGKRRVGRLRTQRCHTSELILVVDRRRCKSGMGWTGQRQAGIVLEQNRRSVGPDLGLGWILGQDRGNCKKACQKPTCDAALFI